MWSHRLLATVDDAAQLPAAIESLFDQQRATWPMLRDGERSLAAMPTRVLRTGRAMLVAQANVRRSASTFAKTDAQSIAQRPCFLCERNLPAAERAIAFGDLVLMPNPFPAIDEHLTIASREHVAQRFVGRIDALHTLVHAVGDTRFLLYNGPRCGASAPDHFHFQCGHIAAVPIFFHPDIDQGEGVSVLVAGGRTALRVRHRDAASATASVAACLDALRALEPAEDEPMVNVLAVRRAGHYVTLLFPRFKHRPTGFSAPDNPLAISPAALEMAGIIVISNPDQFDRVDAAAVETVFAEVCVPPDKLVELSP